MRSGTIVIARDHAKEARTQAGPEPSTAELHAAMVAVTPSAFALDGLYGALTQVLGRRRGKRGWRPTLRQLALGFDVGPKAKTWSTQLEWHFERRQPAVHHDEKSYETVPHPELEAHVSVEDRDYSAAGAERAVGIALDIVRTCVENPKPVTADWVESQRPVLEQRLPETL